MTNISLSREAAALSLLSWLFLIITCPHGRMHPRHCRSQIPSLPLIPGAMPPLADRGCNEHSRLPKQMPGWPVPQAWGGLCSTWWRGRHISHQDARESRARGRRKKVVEQKSFCNSLLVTCLQGPTSGGEGLTLGLTTFSQEQG